MTHRIVDVAILGAGTAGLTARRAAEAAGATAVVIDPGPFGTTCARVGCMPSKLLIAAANAAWHARHADIFGVDADVRVDRRRVMERLQRERDRFAGFVVAAIDEHREYGRLIDGRGRFVQPNLISVDGHTTVEARTVVIATGSTPWVPPPFRDLEGALLTTDQLFELPELPSSVLVVGAGMIGLELGQALHRLGTRVCMASMGGFVGPLLDPKMRRAALDIFQSELDLHLEYELHSVDRVEHGVRVRFTDSTGADRDELFERVLVTTGRRPNLGSLGLENAGVPLDDRGTPVHDHHTLQVGQSHVFIAGDVSGHRTILHEAADEGRIAGENAARWPDELVRPRSTSLAIVFTDPQMAVVGEAWAEQTCDGSRVGEVDFSDQGRARVGNRNKGRVRIYGEPVSGRLRGAELIGPDVEHHAHLLAWAIQQKLTVGQALKMPFYHPVTEEGLRTALRDLQTNLRLARESGRPCEEFGPGD